MLNSSVLVLNRSYLPVHVTSVRRAFGLIYRNAAWVVNEEYETFDFDTWRRLPLNGAVEVVGTVRGGVRVPRVILLPAFDRVPKRHVRYSRVNVFARDRFTCQYCGTRPPRLKLNLDHVVPRSLGGKTTWENVVCCCVDCNRRKGGRTPEQARLRLQRRPSRPRWTPLATHVISNVRYEEWRPFLGVLDPVYRVAGLAD